MDQFYVNDKENDGNRGKKKQKPGSLATFYWLFHIRKDVEVVTSTDEHVKAHFPMRPPCYMLSKRLRSEYREKCDITDSAKKMTDILHSFKVFSLAMDIDLEYFRNNNFIYHFTSREAFDVAEIVLWLQGLIINILLAYDIVIRDGKMVNGGSSFTGLLEYLTYSLIGGSVITIFTWTTIRYEQNQLEKEEEFKIQFPWRDSENPFWSGKITVIDAFFKEGVVTSMIVHIVAGCMSLSGYYIANTLHLF